MSERQARSGFAGRTSTAAPRAIRRVRVMSSGRWHAPLDARPTPTLIAVGAAASGMGKSVVVSNLAASIAGLGRRVVVVDLDFRRPHQHTLLGAPPPDERLDAWLERKRARRDEPARATKIRNLQIVAVRRRACRGRVDGAAARADRGAPRSGQRGGRDRRRAPTTATISSTFRRTRPAPAGHLARDARARGHLCVPAGRRATGGAGPRRATPARSCARFAGGLIGNAIERARGRGVVSRVRAPGARAPRACRCRSFGCLRHSERIVQSIVARQPLIVRRGIDDNVRQFHHIAETLMNDEGADRARLPAAGRSDRAWRSRRCPPTSPATPASTPAIRSTGRRRWSSAAVVTAVRVRDVSESGAGGRDHPQAAGRRHAASCTSTS